MALVVLASGLGAAPAVGTAQDEELRAPEGLRPYLGITGGWFLEGYEGSSADGGLWTVLGGVDFNDRWGLRVQLGPGFQLCGEQDFCHDHERASRVSVVRRIEEPFYLLFGLLHAGAGVEFSLAEGLVVLGEVDAAFLVTSAHIWPLVALAWRF